MHNTDTIKPAPSAASNGGKSGTAPLVNNNQPYEKTRTNADPDSEIINMLLGAKTEKRDQADILLDIGKRAKLIRTPGGAPYAQVSQVDHAETYPISEKGGGFRNWLMLAYEEETGGLPNSTALASAVAYFNAKAVSKGEVQEVYTRIAEHGDAIYLDLANDKWQAVKITAEGWEVVANYPVAFRRAGGVLPLPTPVHGGQLSLFRKYFNVATEDEWVLLVGWLIGVFHPKGPYPIAAISGEAGAAKSNATRYLRNLVDPNHAPSRSAPKDEHALAISARNSRIIALDNLSNIPNWLADAMCRMATGSGYGTRELYTNDQEALFDARRPIVYNGIEDLAIRGDLASRCLTFTLQGISKSDRQMESELERAWAKEHPLILGALLDAVSSALRYRDDPSTRPTELPRMADFAQWVNAAERGLEWKPGTFLAAYEQNSDDATDTVLESSRLAQTVIRFMSQRSQWKGTGEELLTALSDVADEDFLDSPAWPANPIKLSGGLRRIASALRSRGITVTNGKSNGKRFIEVTYLP